MEGSSKALKKGAWTAEEDSLLRQCIDKYGEGKWNLVPLRAGLNRCRKSCRLRWVNYLNPNINRGEFSSDEVDLLIRLHRLLGNRWSLIAGRLPERTANDVKNYWNTNLARNYRCFVSNMRNRERPCSSIVPAPKHNVIRPQPQSFSHNNGCSSLNNLSRVGIREISTRYGSLTSNKGKEKCDVVNRQIDGESMMGKRLLEESQKADVGITIDEEEDTSSIDSMSSTFEKLGNLFNVDTGEFT